jgi:hypothetical protein
MSTELKLNEEEQKELLAVCDAASFDLGIANEGAIMELADSEARFIIPGCADLQMAEVHRFGHRGEFPKTGDWENLLSMLRPGQEILWIAVKTPNKLSFYLALKDNNGPWDDPGEVQELRAVFHSMLGQFTKRSFPESLATERNETDMIKLVSEILDHTHQEVVVTSGQPSPSALEENREFPEPREREIPDSSLNDIIEPFMDEKRFSIVFTVGRASSDDASQALDTMTDLRTALSPWLKVQEARSESDATAITKGKQSGENKTMGQTMTRSILPSLVQKVFGGKSDDYKNSEIKKEAQSRDFGWGGELGGLVGRKLGGLFRSAGGCRPVKLIANVAKPGIAATGATHDWLRESPRNYQWTVTTGKNRSVTKTSQRGNTTTLTHGNARLELVDQRLQEAVRSLKKAAGTGAFYLGAEVFSPRTDLSLRIGQMIVGALSGTRTHVRPFQTAIYRGAGFGDHLLRRMTIEDSYPAITLQSRHIAAMFLPVPEADLPGLRTKRNVFYGKPNPARDLDPDTGESRASDDEGVWLGDLAHLKSGFKGRVFDDRDSPEDIAAFRIPMEDVSSHILIAGTTGSGKTQRAAAILNMLRPCDFQIVVIESAKKTYRHLLKRENVPIRILSLGAADSTALRMNPFYFEPDTKLKRHISILSDALADLLPVEALIGPKLREAIQNCYLDYDWDIDRGIYRGVGTPVYPTMVDLHMGALSVAKALNYGPELNSNYKGALLGRTRLFIDELYQDIFGWGGDRSLDELFGEDDVIIEMDSLPPSEAKMPAFVMSVLLERMRARQHAGLASVRKKNLLIVIEEAHNLLDKRLEGDRPGAEMGGGGFLLKQIVRLLQEGREVGLGIMVVDQSPASLADAVIRNTNTKIIMRISDSEEAQHIGASLGLAKEEYRDLHDLEDGEAIVKVKNAGKALKLAPRSKPLSKVDSPAPTADCQPDYHQAARLIRNIVSVSRRLPDPEAGAGLLRQLTAYLELAGSAPSVRRFFGQKLLASISESLDVDFRMTAALSVDLEHLALQVWNSAANDSAVQLAGQLSLPLARQPWDIANKSFSPGSLPALPTLIAVLKTNPHWIVMNAAEQMGELLTLLTRRDESLFPLEIAYCQLMQLIHCTRDRFEVLQATILQLNPPTN